MVEVREMDDSYILADCPLAGPFDPAAGGEAFPGSRGRSREVRREFFRQVREQYGNCVLFAWDEGKIVGFVMFFPKRVARKLGLKTLPDDALTDRTLVRTGCMDIAKGYRGKGVGTQLVQAMIAWAKEHGWKRIEVPQVARGDRPEDWRWRWAMPKWRKLGFKVVREEPTIAMAMEL